ncbi:hypothetical protein [Fusobacterium perfoetens]|nr:hypothetical protein [Fusobacterium perfoetens]
MSGSSSHVVLGYNSAGFEVLYMNSIPPIGTGTKFKFLNLETFIVKK